MISAVRDVGIKDGKIAAVAEHIASELALKTISAKGLYVSPALIDIQGVGSDGTSRLSLGWRGVADADEAMLVWN